jgi:hypothetical protein
MSWTHVHLRWAVTGMAIGLLIALAPSCGGKKCSADNCATGCCTTDNDCKAGSDTTACGKGGAACSSCAATETCTGNTCTGAGGGGNDGGEDGGFDAGYMDAGQPCVKDDDCSKYHTGSRCDQATNQCVSGTGCNVESDCQLDDPTSYCYRFGLQCRCVTEPGAPTGYTGTCHRRLAPCESCTNDSQCGSDFVFDPQGICKELQGNSDGGKYCFQQKIGSCPCGTVDDGVGYCKPQNNSCENVGCAEDKNCPSGAVCNVGACLCEPRCRWDFQKKELAAPGCPPGKTCWVDDKNLDSTSTYFGAGRCRTPCTAEADCAFSATNKFGGPRLTCRGEQLQGGGMSAKRCRANGDCMDDEECPVQPDTAISLGYCSRQDLSCKTDCRTGNDPITGTNFKDCRAPYACATMAGGPDGGINYCKLQTCLEQGGAQIACTRGEYCCGEDKNNDGIADPCPPASELKPDNCYTAPSPPFCSTCMSNDDCKNLQLPAYLSGAGACANGSRAPSCSPMPTLCINVGPRPGTMMPNINVCAPATFNDVTVDSKGVRADQKGCPAGYPPVDFLPRFGNSQDDYCTSDTDCNLGTDAGTCKIDLNLRLKDGGYGKSCQCIYGTGTPTSMCPNTPPLPDGGLDPARITSACKSSVVGKQVACVQSVGCLPNAQILFTDAGAPKYGCGL